MSFLSFERYCEHLASCPESTKECELARDLFQVILDANGVVGFQRLGLFHQTLTSVYQFELRVKNQNAVLPGGWHFFYVRYHLLLRVSVRHEIRQRPHMTLSLGVGADMNPGLGWDDELGKFNQDGDLLPKVFSKAIHNDPSLWRLLPAAWWPTRSGPRPATLTFQRILIGPRQPTSMPPSTNSVSIWGR